MEHAGVSAPDYVPAAWGAAGLCACASPIPQQKAVRKGAARSICARCGRPTRLELGAR